MRISTEPIFSSLGNGDQNQNSLMLLVLMKTVNIIILTGKAML